jgi:outer membrane immunogenic protein
MLALSKPLRVVGGVVVAAGVALVSISAQAADMRYPAPAAAPAATAYTQPYFDWSGFYVGGFAGGSYGLWTATLDRNDDHGTTKQGASGFSGGGFVGWNYRLDPRLYVGFEADLGMTSASQNNNIFDNDTSRSEYGAFGSVRARIGYAFDRLLVYGTTGVAFANIKNEIQKGRNDGEQLVWSEDMRAGLAVGGGAEYAFTRNLFGRAEYQYNYFGSVNLTNADGNPAQFKNELHHVRVGLGYRF